MKEKNFSTIRLSMRTGKAILNDCSTEQDQYVCLEINDANYRKILEVDLSLTQFARLISSNNDTTCTIRHAFNKDGLFKDEVAPLKSVMNDYSDLMKDSLGSLEGRMEELEKHLYEVCNKKTVSKKEVEQALSEIQVIKNHFISNQKYYINEGKKALAKVHDEQKVVVQNMIDLGKVNELKIESKNESLLLSEDLSPIKDNFVKKQTELKDIKDMTDRQVVDELNQRMNYVAEAQEKLSQKGKLAEDKLNFFCPSAVYTGKQIKLCYKSYQGGFPVDNDIVREYLAYLRSLTKEEYGNAKTHHSFNKKNGTK